MFGQTYDAQDLALISVLIVVECALSLDNALVLGLLAKRLPREDRKKALSYGLAGAICFRLVAVIAATFLFKWNFIKIIGGAYLLFLGLKHLWFKPRPFPQQPKDPCSFEDEAISDTNAGSIPRRMRFWTIVSMIELADIAFSLDSILAAVALIGPAPAGPAVHPKLWIVFVAGIAGAVLMRFVAALVTVVLDRFHRLETAAYWLVAVIGIKLLAEGIGYAGGLWTPFEFQNYHHAGFWIFWAAMFSCLLNAILPNWRNFLSQSE